MVLLSDLNIITIVRGNETATLYSQYTLWDALCQPFYLMRLSVFFGTGYAKGPPCTCKLRFLNPLSSTEQRGVKIPDKDFIICRTITELSEFIQPIAEQLDRRKTRFLSLRGVPIHRDDAAIYRYRTIEIASLAKAFIMLDAPGLKIPI